MIKKIYTTFGILAFFYLTLSMKIYAQGIPIPNPSRFNSLEDIVSFFAQLIRPIFLITFLAILLFGAFSYMTSNGDPQKVESARNIIIAGIIGFVLAVLAPTIISLVAGFLGVNVSILGIT